MPSRIAPIRALLDVNILGRGYGAEATRTGIFRATEHLLRALALRDDIRLGLAAEASWVSELQLLSYLRDRQPTLESAVVRAWSHPDSSDNDGITLIRRVLALEAGGSEARKERADLMLRNATARRSRPPETFDLLHSLRTPLPSPDRLAVPRRVLTVHDVIPLLYPEWMYAGAEAEVRGILTSLNRERDFVIVSSRSTAADVAGCLALPDDRIRVTPLAADPALFHAEDSPVRIREIRRKYAIPDGPYILSLGTLEPRKNVSTLLRAFFRLLERSPEIAATLVLVGPKGWKTDELFATLDLGGTHRDRIHLTGFVDDADLAPIYAGAEAFAYPSLYEGFGLPVLEAMQCGAPVITSNRTSMPEVAGDAAIYVDPTSVEELCLAQHLLLTDQALRVRLRAAGLEQARRFSWTRTAAATVDVYQAMLA